MVSNKLMAVAFAALTSMTVVDAGVCIPHGTTIVSSASATETSTTATATSTSVTIETGSTTTSGTVSAETGSTTTETSSGTTSASSIETTSTAAETSSTFTTSTQITSSAVETSSATTSAQTTSTTAQVVPTNLVTNPEFDNGLQPWQAIPYPDQDLSLTSDSFRTEKAALLHFESKSGSAFTNYLYHRIDKSLLKAGSYALEGFVKVDSGDAGEGCNRVVAACLVGPIGLTEAILEVAAMPAIFAETRWAYISTVCDVTEEKLEEIDDFGVAIGFECLNTNAYVDSVSFKPVEIVIE